MTHWGYNHDVRNVNHNKVINLEIYNVDFICISYAGVNRQFQRHKKEQEVIWKFADALWQWREVKEQTDNVDLAIEREFLFDETALATKVTI